MSRINHPMKIGPAVSLSLVAVAPGIAAATLTPGRARRAAAPVGAGRACLMARWLQSGRRGDQGRGRHRHRDAGRRPCLAVFQVRRDHLNPVTR
jgi:hypothetical protein